MKATLMKKGILWMTVVSVIISGCFLLMPASGSANELLRIEGGVRGTGTDTDARARLDARFRADSSRLRLELKKLAPNSTFDINVGGVSQGPVTTNNNGRVRIEFRSNDITSPLDFNPNNQVINIVDSGSGNAIVIDLATPAIGIKLREQTHLALVSAPPGSDARARVRITPQGRKKFDIRINRLPVGIYEIFVAGVQRGTVEVVQDPLIPGFTRGAVKFDSSPLPPDLLLDFEPRGQGVEIRQGATVFFSDTMRAKVALAP